MSRATRSWPPGLFFWNGRSWHQLSTVCGGSGEASRIAWAGPDEFWVITETERATCGGRSRPVLTPRTASSSALTSTPLQSPDPFRPMDAAACDGPNDCWFAGIGSQDPSGQRVGAFHLHWDGTKSDEFLSAPGPWCQRVLHSLRTEPSTRCTSRSAPKRETAPTLSRWAPPSRSRRCLFKSSSTEQFTDVNFLPLPPPWVHRLKGPSCYRLDPTAPNCGSPAAALHRAQRPWVKAPLQVRRWRFVLPATSFNRSRSMHRCLA